MDNLTPTKISGDQPRRLTARLAPIQFPVKVSLRDGSVIAGDDAVASAPHVERLDRTARDVKGGFLRGEPRATKCERRDVRLARLVRQLAGLVANLSARVEALERRTVADTPSLARRDV